MVFDWFRNFFLFLLKIKRLRRLFRQIRYFLYIFPTYFCIFVFYSKFLRRAVPTPSTANAHGETSPSVRTDSSLSRQCTSVWTGEPPRTTGLHRTDQLRHRPLAGTAGASKPGRPSPHCLRTI